MLQRRHELNVFENHAIATGWSAIAPRSRTLPASPLPLAADGKIALDAYPNVVWIERIKGIQAMSVCQDCRGNSSITYTISF